MSEILSNSTNVASCLPAIIQQMSNTFLYVYLNVALKHCLDKCNTYLHGFIFVHQLLFYREEHFAHVTIDAVVQYNLQHS